VPRWPSTVGPGRPADLPFLRGRANRTRGPSVCDDPRSIGEAKAIQAIAETIRVTVADLLPAFISAFEAEWKRELTRRAVASPTADLDAEIARQATRVDRLAAAVADAPDIVHSWRNSGTRTCV
jgi:hypothetical protein